MSELKSKSKSKIPFVPIKSTSFLDLKFDYPIKFYILRFDVQNNFAVPDVSTIIHEMISPFYNVTHTALRRL